MIYKLLIAPSGTELEIFSQTYAIVIFSILTVVAILAYRYNKVSLSGAITGGVLSMLLLIGSGLISLLLFMAFFYLGSAATHYKYSWKQSQGLQQANKGARGWKNALANAGLPAFIAGLSIPGFLETSDSALLVAVCFAVATADTLASELGNVFGTHYYDVLNWQRGKRGPDGMISLEGSGIAILGSSAIGLIWYIFAGYGFWLVLILGFIGMFVDSVFGALARRLNWQSGHLINFLSQLSSLFILCAMLR